MHKLKALVLVFSILVSTTAMANEVVMIFGFNTTEFSSKTDTATFQSKIGLEAGMLYYRELFNGILLRTGGILTQRSSAVLYSGESYKVQLLYVDVPATVQYAITDKVSLFGGVVFGMKVSESCDGCGISALKSMLTALEGGLNIEVKDNVSIEGFINLGLTDIGTDTELGSHMGAALTYKF